MSDTIIDVDEQLTVPQLQNEASLFLQYALNAAFELGFAAGREYAGKDKVKNEPQSGVSYV